MYRWKQKSERREDAAVFEEEEGAIGQGMWVPLEAGKARKQILC